jgi:hypothetical protein
MQPTINVVAGLLVLAGVVGTIWALALKMGPGVRPKKLMIAPPLCMVMGVALLLGIIAASLEGILSELDTA